MNVCQLEEDLKQLPNGDQTIVSFDKINYRLEKRVLTFLLDKPIELVLPELVI
jgi:hypothetical protein